MTCSAPKLVMLQASASRDLRFVYVIWEALSPSGKSSGESWNACAITI